MAINLTTHFAISTLGLIIFFTTSSYSIRCWDCNSNTDPKCADPFDNSTVHMKDCEYAAPLPQYPNVKSTMCRKIRQKVNGKWRYFRDCAYLGEPGIGGDERYCLMRTGTHNIFVEICTCASRHGCNSASLSLYSVAVLFGSILCAFYLR
ncbi:UPAR/Ly6 domain-containing protein crok-like [Planococcus citri]|uniref:UPAR/Ly6 domain-containing protein crok-like n=1 Tax=Planococcus citri TaxID=170843 RepID=UPI0031F91077